MGWDVAVTFQVREVVVKYVRRDGLIMCSNKYRKSFRRSVVNISFLEQQTAVIAYYHLFLPS